MNSILFYPIYVISLKEFDQLKRDLQADRYQVVVEDKKCKIRVNKARVCCFFGSG
jgi:hypothetical protein